ncbi:ribonuclease R [Lactococcus termiticola]|uniref:Ribonuclease R n=1 Tax=Lactococcus termiticola TaxID=2169526 RepID=A0A2R5HGC0_9LACT|nr:ribonuclease R [Lactococcus termiticola]GBG97113.1 exoribonuclease R [Lactococcus termiticola]
MAKAEKTEVKTETKEKDKIKGVFHSHPKGFGFVTPETETTKENDIFIGPRNTKDAMHGDTVEVKVLHPKSAKRGADGVINKVVERATTEVVGSYIPFGKKDRENFSKDGFVARIIVRNEKLPDNLFVKEAGFQAEDLVRVKIIQYPAYRKHFIGKVTDVIGHKGDPGLDVLEILSGNGIPEGFPEPVLKMANSIPETIDEADLEGRRDFREELTYTIDGDDSKDLDDAIHIKKLDNGNFELGVHIADVSHYVTEGSIIDEEAIERGTSVYVVDRVVPMLPERLSNGICSLNEAEERLTLSCVMEIDHKGKVVKSEIMPSVIKTTYRMTYNNVNKILTKGAEGHREMRDKFDKIVDSLEVAKDLHEILEGSRDDRGAIEFPESEAKIVLDEKGHPIDIIKRDRDTAERMIESFMLAANETVAAYFIKNKLPSIYRIHDLPKEKAFAKLQDMAADKGFNLSSNSNQALQYFQEEIKGTPYELSMSYQLRHTMSTAIYSEKNTGHYGLASKNYTHFTSPIRRYPDLLVHRLIHLYIDNHSNKIKEEQKEKIPAIAKQSSERERRAVVAERMVDAMKKAEYMADHLDETFEGTITSIQKFGCFVELPNTIEGLVRIMNLKSPTKEKLDFDEEEEIIKGNKTDFAYRIGDKIVVHPISADKRAGKIDFEQIL